MVVTQSRNILICLFVRVVFDLVVWLSFQTVCTKVRVVQEVASQLYSDVMESNPILRYKTQHLEQFCENKQMRMLHDDHSGTVLRAKFLQTKH